MSALIIFAIFAVAIGHGGSMTQFKPDWPGRPLPEDRTVRAHDVADAQFSLAFRGYRMAEVDEALDRLAVEIAERDEQIQRLTGQPFEYVPPAPPVTPEPGDPEPIEPIATESAPEPALAEPVGVEPLIAEPWIAERVSTEPVSAEHLVDGGGPATQPIPPVIEPGVER